MPNLDKLHPDLLSKANLVLAAMKALGFEMKIVQGVRTTEEQQKLYAQGRTASGVIVTNADGVIKKSNHQLKADGFGHAVDCAFVVNNKISWADNMPWVCYGACAQALGLVWGGSWKSITDRPHIELP